jgi:hypothetical protein
MSELLQKVYALRDELSKSQAERDQLKAEVLEEQAQRRYELRASKKSWEKLEEETRRLRKALEEARESLLNAGLITAASAARTALAGKDEG